MAYNFLNKDKHFQALLGCYKEVINDCGDNLTMGEDTAVEFAEEEAERLTESHIKSMNTYVHQYSTRMIGNFADIREDWDYITTFVKSEVTPWGRFDDIVKSIDDETISQADLEKFQQWCEDWFWTAFGSYNIKYNFGTWLGDIDDEYRREEDKMKMGGEL